MKIPLKIDIDEFSLTHYLNTSFRLVVSLEKMLYILDIWRKMPLNLYIEFVKSYHSGKTYRIFPL